jgi:hypothetical protein
MNRAAECDLAAESEGLCLNEESIEEIFDQLWAIPKSERARVPEPRAHGNALVWVRKDLVRAGKVTLVDCFPVNKSHKFEGSPSAISFAQDIWEGGVRPTYTKVLRRFPMAEGGRWVWKEDKPICLSTSTRA